jgi:hypothetical protein
MKKIILLSVLLFCRYMQAQTLYAVSNEKKIYSINQDYTATYLFTAGPTQYLINDIAISPAGKMYGIAYNTLVEINTTTGAATFVAEMPPNFYTSLVCSNDYELYMINSLEKNLYKYNLLTHEIINVGYVGFETPGDLTFYKGNLIFQTYNDSGSIYMVKAYNLETGNLTDIMCQSFYFQLWGLTTIYDTCDSGTILASNPATELMDLDFDLQTFPTLPLQFPESEQIFGLATSNEYLGSLCTSQDLGDLNCELSIAENTANEPIVYPNPVADILHFKNYEQIKSLIIYDVTGKQVKATDKPSVSGIDISNLAAGVYVLKIETGENYSIRKIIKQ